MVFIALWNSFRCRCWLPCDRQNVVEITNNKEKKKKLKFPFSHRNSNSNCAQRSHRELNEVQQRYLFAFQKTKEAQLRSRLNRMNSWNYQAKREMSNSIWAVVMAVAWHGDIRFGRNERKNIKKTFFSGRISRARLPGCWNSQKAKVARACSQTHPLICSSRETFSFPTQQTCIKKLKRFLCNSRHSLVIRDHRDDVNFLFFAWAFSGHFSAMFYALFSHYCVQILQNREKTGLFALQLKLDSPALSSSSHCHFPLKLFSTEILDLLPILSTIHLSLCL